MVAADEQHGDRPAQLGGAGEPERYDERPPHRTIAGGPRPRRTPARLSSGRPLDHSALQSYCLAITLHCRVPTRGAPCSLSCPSSGVLLGWLASRRLAIVLQIVFVAIAPA